MGRGGPLGATIVARGAAQLSYGYCGDYCGVISRTYAP